MLQRPNFASPAPKCRTKKVAATTATQQNRWWTCKDKFTSGQYLVKLDAFKKVEFYVQLSGSHRLTKKRFEGQLNCGFWDSSLLHFAPPPTSSPSSLPMGSGGLPSRPSTRQSARHREARLLSYTLLSSKPQRRSFPVQGADEADGSQGRFGLGGALPGRNHLETDRKNLRISRRAQVIDETSKPQGRNQALQF